MISINGVLLLNLSIKSYFHLVLGIRCSITQVQSVGPNEMNKSYVLGSGEHAMSLGLTSETVQWSQPVRFVITSS